MSDSEDIRAPPNLPKPVPRTRRMEVSFDAAFAVHLMEGGGMRRGLKGGSQTLDDAQTSYLKTEWSGAANRRARLGAKTSKAI